MGHDDCRCDVAGDSWPDVCLSHRAGGGDCLVWVAQVLSVSERGATGEVQTETPPPAAEPQEHNGESNDPVGLFSGDFRYAFADLAIAGRGPSPAFIRSYNSADTRSGAMGPGWMHNYYTRLRQPGDASGDLLFVAANGNTDR